ncbi:MAG: carbohydrate kinase [Firmicutes bacterium]|nr:carbohydrate kinase [Bacillota bacterium]
MDKYILSIDCGTQSVRGLIFDTKGKLISKEKVEFKPYFSLYPGWAEQNPKVYFNSLSKACRRLKIKNENIWNKIIGVSLTTQRDTYINLDSKGNILRPAIVWLDQRTAQCSKSLSPIDNIILYSVGMKKAIDIFRKQSKANWLKENEPEIWKKTNKYLLLSGYLTYKLTDKFVDSIASQIGHIPFDYKNKEWLKKNSFKWDIFGIEKDKLPKIIKPGKVLGNITKKASELTLIKEGLPLIASGSDKGCETLGSGCLTPKCGSISFGSTATIQTTSKNYLEPKRFLPSYPSVIPNCYNPEIQIYRGYWMISWFKNEFSMKELIEAKEKKVSPESLLNKRLKDIPPGSNGLILQPYWGPSLKMPRAKGAIIGFGDVHTRIHIYRAIIEGINYALLEGLEKIEKKTKVKMERIMVSGGGSQSDVICQITADMLNRPVYRVQTYETSGLGAAISGFVGLGVYNSCEEAVKRMVHYQRAIEPDIENVKIYNKLYKRVYKKIYSRLNKLYREISDITKYPDI